MSIHDRSGTAGRLALRFGCLLILLAGIVGMHGLNSHGGGMAPDVHPIVVHEPAVASMPAAVATLGAVATGAVATGAVATGAVATGAAGVMGWAAVEGVPGGQLGMTALCMAVLALALTLLLRMLGSAPVLPLFRLVGAPSRAPGPLGRDPDPPSLTVLSIRRC